jgi:septal ring factor EnvC (AmiA/AmiB activator)
MTQNTGSSKGIFLVVAAFLAVAAIALGVFAFMQTGKLNEARNSINSLEANVTNLEGNVASLQGQLTTEKANVTELTGDLSAATANVTRLTSDLSSANVNVAKLTSDLTAEKANVTKLTADLSAANAKVTSTQASLDKANADLTKATADLATVNANLAKANADLTAAKATNATLTTDLNKIKAPRHFTSLDELNAWLAKDDTNFNPKYASYDALQRAYVLQIKAARDGFIISTMVDTDGTRILVVNEAIAGSTLYVVSAVLDIALPGIPNLPTPSIPLALE